MKIAMKIAWMALFIVGSSSVFAMEEWMRSKKIHSAVRAARDTQESIDQLEALIKAGHNINEREGIAGRTAIFNTFRPGSENLTDYKPEILKFLIRNGADVNILDKQNNTVLDWAYIALANAEENKALDAKIHEIITILKKAGAQRGKDLNK